jgi:hypothetical protein
MFLFQFDIKRRDVKIDLLERSPMTAKPTISLFPTRDPEGQALRQDFVPLARSLGFAVREHSEINVQLYTEACLRDDLVVLDATVTRKGWHNYEIVFPTPLDHLLIVSRGYLPINYYGLRDAIFDPATGKLIYGTPFYPNSLTNDALLRWLFLQLCEIRPHLPRSAEEKGVLGTFWRGIRQSLNALDERRVKTGQIFISYRSQDWEAVSRLKRRIEAGEFHAGQPQAVRCFPPNTLSDEVMTEQRRWQMLSLIDRFIGPADEVWAFEGQNYYDSWWTLGELMILAYRREAGYRGNQPPDLRIFKTAADRPQPAPDDYLPVMSRAQQRRMARWFANCDTTSMGVESIVAIRILAQLPLIGRLPYLQDHAWSNQFWRHPILDCKRCRQVGKQRNHVDVESFLWTRGPGFSRFTPEEMESQLEKRQITCRNCLSRYAVVEGPPQYLWMPVVNGHQTGDYLKLLFELESDDPDEFSLVPLRTYRILS